jgi:hypothetical protein
MIAIIALTSPNLGQPWGIRRLKLRQISDSVSADIGSWGHWHIEGRDGRSSGAEKVKATEEGPWILTSLIAHEITCDGICICSPSYQIYSRHRRF